MATFIMLPDGTTGTNEWQKSFGSASYEAAVQTDDDNSSYVFETRNGHEITFTMANPSVAEADIDFNEDVVVRPTVTAHYTADSGTVDMTIRTTGSGILLGTQTRTIIVDDSYPSYNGISTTFKSIGNAWNYAGLENCQVRLECTGTPAFRKQLRVSYVFMKVDYTAAAVAVTDNATFFGSNF
jgi:hypothetical protein